MKTWPNTIIRANAGGPDQLPSRLLTLALMMACAVLLFGCLLGYPARAKVSSVEMSSRFGPLSNRVETIVARYTFHRCVMLLTPDGAFQDLIHSVDKEYLLRRADHSETALRFLRGREWKKILPVPSTNLGVAISQPERRGRCDDLDVVVFREGVLVRKRSLRAVALATEKRYTGFLAFSHARWVIWYPAEDGQIQYDILRDTSIRPLQEWRKDEAETLMWMPSDVSPLPQ